MIKIGGDQKKLFAYWQDIMDSGHFTEGKYVKRLEEAVGKFYGMDAIAVNSAGTGLYTILRSLDLNFGQEVAVCNNTFYATGGSAYEVTHNVTLVDADRGDFCMSPDGLRFAAHRSENDLKAVILTQVGGGLSRHYARIAGYCEGIDAFLVEDAAHALGVKDMYGHLAGSLSVAAVFSFYPTKSVPAGDGGIIVTSDAKLAERMRRFRNYGKYFEEGQIKYDPFGGFNFRMDEWTAAVALHQFERIDEIIEKRQAAAFRLSKVVEPMIDWGMYTNWYKFIVPADFKTERKTGQVYSAGDQLKNAMNSPGEFLTSDWIAANHTCLPIGEDLYDRMTTGDIEAWLQGRAQNPNIRN